MSDEANLLIRADATMGSFAGTLAFGRQALWMLFLGNAGLWFLNANEAGLTGLCWAVIATGAAYVAQSVYTLGSWPRVGLVLQLTSLATALASGLCLLAAIP